MGTIEKFPQEQTPSPENAAVKKTKEKCEAVTERIERIQAEHKDKVDGGSSFRDVTRNLLSIGKRYVAFCEEQFEPKDLEIAEQNLSYLEAYLDILEAKPDILEKEISVHDGAFPELRNAADAAAAAGKTKKPIFYYIDSIVDSLEKSYKKAA